MQAACGPSNSCTNSWVLLSPMGVAARRPEAERRTASSSGLVQRLGDMLHAQLAEHPPDGVVAGNAMIQLAAWPEIPRGGAAAALPSAAAAWLAGLPRGSAAAKHLQQVAYAVKGVARFDVHGPPLQDFLAAARAWLGAFAWRPAARVPGTGGRAGQYAASVLFDWLEAEEWLPPPPPPALVGMVSCAALYRAETSRLEWRRWRLLQAIGYLATSYPPPAHSQDGMGRAGGAAQQEGDAGSGAGTMESGDAGSSAVAEDQRAAVAAGLAGKLDDLLAASLESVRAAAGADPPAAAGRMLVLVKALQALAYTPAPGVAGAVLSAARACAAPALSAGVSLIPGGDLAGICAALHGWHSEAGVALEREAVAALAARVAELQRERQGGDAGELPRVQEAHACMTALLEAVGERPQDAAPVLAEA